MFLMSVSVTPKVSLVLSESTVIIVNKKCESRLFDEIVLQYEMKVNNRKLNTGSKMLLSSMEKIDVDRYSS